MNSNLIMKLEHRRAHAVERIKGVRAKGGGQVCKEANAIERRHTNN